MSAAETHAEGDESGGRKAKHSSAREWYESLLVAGIFVLFVRTFVVQTYQVPTGSMEKTILVGDHLLVNKFAYAPRLERWAKLFPYRDVHRGDIIVFKKPGDDVNPGNVLVKRAVAGPGDTLSVRDKALFVNGRPADGSGVQHTDPETYPNDPAIPEVARRRDQFGPFRVPPDHWFGMGDNRDNSLDSRYWGPIPRGNIFGRPTILYWSYEAEPNSHVWRGPAAKIRQLADVAIHFFSRTRWNRMFRLVR
ncbi:MAG TPA: signal peptidase I [Thermoanaerobaculia bacterium]|nr:signal peptidase I [Thermoanaerobaculia bacterium]